MTSNLTAIVAMRHGVGLAAKLPNLPVASDRTRDVLCTLGAPKR